MINDLPYDITHLTIGIQKVAELINKCLVLAKIKITRDGLRIF